MEGLHSKLNFNRALDVILELRLKTKMSADTAEVFTQKNIFLIQSLLIERPYESRPVQVTNRTWDDVMKGRNNKD